MMTMEERIAEMKKKLKEKNVNSKIEEVKELKTKDEKVKVDTLFQNETIWMSQKMMSKLFWINENNITYHLWEIYN